MTQPMRQGDVIESTDPDANKWQRNLVVITADCDFANAKHQGRVTCVPILTQDEYVMEFQIPRIRERTLSKLVALLAAELAKYLQVNISPQRLREWPTEERSSRIIKALDLDTAVSSNTENLIEAIRLIQSPVDRLEDAVANIIRSQVDIPNGKKEINARREVIESLKAHYGNPPGDALFLSAVAPKLASGYFIYLRHLEQIRETDIAMGPTRHPVRYRRLARLKDSYMHAVSQQFALVFMSIGMPQEYEEMRQLHADVLGERFI